MEVLSNEGVARWVCGLMDVVVDGVVLDGVLFSRGVAGWGCCSIGVLHDLCVA